MKVIIRKLLAEVEGSRNYEMYVIGGVEIDPNGIRGEMRVALDIDDSVQNCKFKIREALTRWSLVEHYNYRAPVEIKYEQFRKDYRKVFYKYWKKFLLKPRNYKWYKNFELGFEMKIIAFG